MTDSQLIMILGFGAQTMTSIGLFANQWLQGKKAERAIQERALALQEATAREAYEVRRANAVTALQTHAKLDNLKELQLDNTRVTTSVGERADAAYREANDLNLKILDVKQDSKEKLDRIDTVTTDTNEVVQTLKQNGKT